MRSGVDFLDQKQTESCYEVFRLRAHRRGGISAEEMPTNGAFEQTGHEARIGLGVSRDLGCGQGALKNCFSCQHVVDSANNPLTGSLCQCRCSLRTARRAFCALRTCMRALVKLLETNTHPLLQLGNRNGNSVPGQCRLHLPDMFLDHLGGGKVSATKEMDPVFERQKSAPFEA